MSTAAAHDAAMVATTADQAVAYERHMVCRTSVALLVGDQPTVALDVLTRSVRRQARLAGCGPVDIPIADPSAFRAYVVFVNGRQVA